MVRVAPLRRPPPLHAPTLTTSMTPPPAASSSPRINSRAQSGRDADTASATDAVSGRGARSTEPAGGRVVSSSAITPAPLLWSGGDGPAPPLSSRHLLLRPISHPSTRAMHQTPEKQPQLCALRISDGELHPPFSPERRVYVLLLPPHCPAVTLQAQAEVGAFVRIDRRGVGDSATFSLPPGVTCRKVLIEVLPHGAGHHNHLQPSRPASAYSGQTATRSRSPGVVWTPPSISSQPTRPTSSNPAHSDASASYVIDVRRDAATLDGEGGSSGSLGAASATFRGHSATVRVANLFRAVAAFSGRGGGMLSLAPGDLIATSQETAVCATASSPTGDTWWHGIDVHTGREGAFPAHCVTPIEGAEAAALRSPGTTSTTVSFAAEADKSKALREPDPPALLLAPPPARLLGRTVQWIRETPATTLLLLVHTLLLLAALAKEGDVVSLVKNPSLGVSGATLRALGACSQSHVHSGHVYLLLTHALLPVGFFRAVVDTAGVVLVTAPQEQRLGTRTAVLAWVIGTIGGGLCSCVFTSAWLFAGASVGVFASIGVDLAEVYLLRVVREGERERRGEARIAPAPPEVRQRVRRALVVVAVNLLLGGIPGQNNWAMLGALLIGWFFGLYWLGLEAIDSAPSRAKVRAHLSGLTYASCLVLAVALPGWWGRAGKRERESDAQREE